MKEPWGGRCHQVSHLLQHEGATLRKRFLLLNAVMGFVFLAGRSVVDKAQPQERSVETCYGVLRPSKRAANEDQWHWVKRATRVPKHESGIGLVVFFVMKAHVWQIWFWRATIWRDAARQKSNPHGCGKGM